MGASQQECPPALETMITAYWNIELLGVTTNDLDADSIPKPGTELFNLNILFPNMPCPICGLAAEASVFSGAEPNTEYMGYQFPNCESMYGVLIISEATGLVAQQF